MDGPVLGIDLGTTNSVAAIAVDGGARVLQDTEGYELVPSVVSFHPGGDILVGRSARERRLLDARNTVYSIKRLIGRPYRSPEVERAQQRFPFELLEGPTGGVLVSARGDTYSLSEISAFVLRQVRAIAEASLDTTCTRAVVTVPANFNELQRSATKAAGRVAGLDVLRILNEPTAAALAYGYGRGSRERIAIFDLGGGTFDLTILELSGDVFEVLATAGDTYLGGDDIDVLISDQMADAFLEHHQYDPRGDAQAYERLRAAAEWAKCQLSAEEEVQLRIEELAYGDGGVSLDLGFGLTRQTLEQMVQPLITRAFDVCEDAMRVAAIRPTQLDNVILVGGSTRMPLVQRMVAEYFGREPLSNIDPDLVVAQGAAIQGAALVPAEERRALGRVRLKRMTQSDLQAVRQSQLPPSPSAPPPAGFSDDEPTVVRRSSHPSQVPAGPGSVAPRTRFAPGDVQTLATAEVDFSNFEQDDIDTAVEPSRPSAAPPAARPPSAAPPAARPPSAAPPAARSPSAAPPRPPAMPPLPPPIAPLVPQPIARVGGRPPGATTLPFPAVVPPSGFGEVQPAPPQPAFAPDRPRLEPEPSALPPFAETAPRVEMAAEPEPLAPPLLLDVTPQTLGVETVSGFCEPIIHRNAAIPVEQTKVFSTAQDHQQVVRVRICQGESRRLAGNQQLGEIELAGLRTAARGEVKIGVTFVISADGTLGVRARDLDTGQEQSIRINLVGGASEQEIARMRQRQAQLMGR